MTAWLITSFVLYVKHVSTLTREPSKAGPTNLRHTASAGTPRQAAGEGMDTLFGDGPLKGYSAPRSPEGRSSLVPAPPWHYVGDMLVIEFWADARGRRGGAARRRWSRIPTAGGRRRCSSTGSRAATAGRSCSTRRASQYREFFITVNALYEGEEVAFCPYIWVDRDFALARGWIQGFPKKLGSVWITRTFGLDTAADPGLRPGRASRAPARPTTAGSPRRP